LGLEARLSEFFCSILPKPVEISTRDIVQVLETLPVAPLYEAAQIVTVVVVGFRRQLGTAFGKVHFNGLFWRKRLELCHVCRLL